MESQLGHLCDSSVHVISSCIIGVVGSCDTLNRKNRSVFLQEHPNLNRVKSSGEYGVWYFDLAVEVNLLLYMNCDW